MPWDKWKQKHSISKHMECSVSKARGKCTAVNTYIKKWEESQKINKQTICLKELEIEEQIKPKADRRK